MVSVIFVLVLLALTLKLWAGPLLFLCTGYYFRLFWWWLSDRRAEKASKSQKAD